MKEMLLMYHIDDETKKIIDIILQQLDVEMKEIADHDTHQFMGYLIGLPGFQSQKRETETELTEPFLFFAYFTEEQLDIILEVFKNAGIPYIPYKAMLTNDNVNYTFEQLYQNVEQEYRQLTGQSN